MTADRGRDTSDELTEVRTVLSRARNARATLARYKANETTHDYPRTGRWDYAAVPPRWVDATYNADPDIDQMIEALDTTIAALARWERKGRAKKS